MSFGFGLHVRFGVVGCVLFVHVCVFRGFGVCVVPVLVEFFLFFLGGFVLFWGFGF